MPGHNMRLAVLIDADNVAAALADALFAETRELGTATVRRAYGTSGGLTNWAKAMARWGVLPMPALAGKNATDIAMVIDAMDILHTGTVDGFCLVSSDRDFTRLAIRLREAGVPVYGFGKTAAPDAVDEVYTRFRVLSAAVPVKDTAKTNPAKKAPAAPAPTPKGEGDPQWLRAAMESIVAKGGSWAHLPVVGKKLKQCAGYADKFGGGKLSRKLAKIDFLEVSADKVRRKPNGV